MTPRDKIKATLAFEDLLMVSRVDLIILPEASPFLCLDIIDGEILYTSDHDETARIPMNPSFLIHETLLLQNFILEEL